MEILYLFLWSFLVVLRVQWTYAFKITGATSGINSQNGARPYRYEISDFQYHGPAFDLFILSLSSFQSANQSDQLSYFQIAGLRTPISSLCIVGN